MHAGFSYECDLVFASRSLHVWPSWRCLFHVWPGSFYLLISWFSVSSRRGFIYFLIYLLLSFALLTLSLLFFYLFLLFLMGGWGEGVIRYSLVEHVTCCDLALRALSYFWPIWQHATFFMSSDEGVARASFLLSFLSSFVTDASNSCYGHRKSI